MLNENYLSHHGTKGMKWGIRRYQRSDGSLTLAGKKRALKIQDQYTTMSNDKKYRDKNGNLTYAGRKKALKMQDKYSKVTGGKQLRKFSNSNTSQPNREVQKTKNKSISEMSNQELQAKIDRIRLENTLKDLTPKNISTGQKFVNGIKNTAVSIIKDKGTRIIGDYVDKKVRDKLGLNSKSTSKILQEKAQNYENRQKIDKGQKYFKEGKYAEKNNTSEAFSKKTSDDAKSKKPHDKQTARNHYYDDPIDVEWREVNNSDINRGQSYTSRFLLEDKKKKNL